jgi:hypothetical protein
MDTRRIRHLRTPVGLKVDAKDGLPSRVLLTGLWQDVELARKPWRIDQHWWREDRILRDYFQVMPSDSPALTIYHDLISDEWARQQF